MTHPPPTHFAPSPRRKVKGKVITGIVCLGLAFAGLIATVVFLVLGLIETDADVPVDGRPHTVALEGDDERVIYVEEGGDASCEVRNADGEPVSTDPVRITMTRSVNGDDREAIVSFDPPGDEVEVTCSGPDQLDAQVAPSLVSGADLAILVVGFGLSGILGVTGLVLLVVALVQKLSSPGR